MLWHRLVPQVAASRRPRSPVPHPTSGPTATRRQRRQSALDLWLCEGGAVRGGYTMVTASATHRCAISTRWTSSKSWPDADYPRNCVR